MNQFDIDRTAELINIIIENNRCTVCDKPIGKRVRYPCGHTSCEDCVSVTESCPFCLIPPASSTFTTPAFDAPCTLRSQNANNLLTTFQTEFNIDVHERKRISEQLKVEKELFPHCIQAHCKYYNKRKYSKSFIENKENIVPGEEASFLSKMESTNRRVQEWVNKIVKRKPLADLNNTRTDFNDSLKDLSKRNVLTERSHRKRKHADIWSDENKPFVDDQPSHSKIHRKKKSFYKIENTKAESSINGKVNKDDSGIAIDGDEVIVINDSQSIQVDKDMNAWLAVLEAENNPEFRTTLVSKVNNITQSGTKVPFYKKSSLSKYCKDCFEFYENEKKSKEPRDVSIKIENDSFTAVINITKVQNNKNCTKQSVEVQTDFNDDEIDKNDSNIDEGNVSEDLSLREADFKLNPMNKSERKHSTSNIIIEETDSDEEIEQSTSLTVIADVHRSCDDILILGDVENVEEHSKRPRRAPRGHTPASTDSSEKENYNPNRRKRTKNLKKKPLKK